MEGRKGASRVADVCSLCEEAIDEKGRDKVLAQGAEALEEAVRVIDTHRGSITAAASASAIRKELTAAIQAFLSCLGKGVSDPQAQTHEAEDAQPDLDDTSAINPNAQAASDRRGPQALSPKVEGAKDSAPGSILPSESPPAPAGPPDATTENPLEQQAQE